MKLHFFTPLSVVSVLLLCAIWGCTEDPTDPGEKFGKPTNVVLQKLSNTSFSVAWVRATSDKEQDVVRIVRTAPTAAQWDLTVTSHTSVVTATDSSIELTGGMYLVTVASRDSTSDA